MRCNKFLLPLFFLGAVFMLTACASSRSGQVYSRDQARQPMRVSYGTVKDVRPVQIEGTQSGAGAVVGGVTGGILGSMVGKGDGQTLGTLAGALGGAAAGAAIEDAATKKDGLEITVQLDSGETISVVQEADVPFSPGERVRILYGTDGAARVRK